MTMMDQVTKHSFQDVLNMNLDQVKTLSKLIKKAQYEELIQGESRQYFFLLSGMVTTRLNLLKRELKKSK